jgi:hypothetical protein
MEATKDMRFPEMAKNLLTQFEQKKLTLSEFLRECAYWAIREGFDELRPAPYPTKPEAVVDFEGLPKEKRLRLGDDYYIDHPEVKSYYEQKTFIRNLNNARLCWLQEILQYLPEEDQGTRNLIQLKINAFIAARDYVPQGYNEARRVFNGKPAGQWKN